MLRNVRFILNKKFGFNSLREFTSNEVVNYSDIKNLEVKPKPNKFTNISLESLNKIKKTFTNKTIGQLFTQLKNLDDRLDKFEKLRVLEIVIIFIIQDSIKNRK